MALSADDDKFDAAAGPVGQPEKVKLQHSFVTE